MTNRKKIAAKQVSAVTNSYMLPQGDRCTANPRVTTAVVCAVTATAASAMAACTQRPACLIARKGGRARAGIESRPLAVSGTPAPVPLAAPPALLAPPTLAPPTLAPPALALPTLTLPTLTLALPTVAL